MKKDILHGILIIFLGIFLISRQFINYNSIFSSKYIYSAILGILVGVLLIYSELKKRK